MIPEIIIGSSLGTVTGRMINGALDRYSNLTGDPSWDSNSGGDIKWDTTPDHDGGWTDSGWSCDQWMYWHKKLVEHYGNDAEAKDHFLREWDKQSTWDNQYNWCKYRADFQDYFKAHGIGVPAVVGVVTNAGQAAESVSESAADIADEGIGGFGDSISTILKWLPWLALAVAVILIYFHFRTVKKVVKA